MREKAWLRYSMVLALTLSLAGAGNPQKGTRTTVSAPDRNTSSSPDIYLQEVEPFPSPSGQPDTALALAARQERLRQEDRQKHLTADTAKLVELSTLLQAEVNRAGGKNVLSLENLRRTEEIEKLARKVRERLKG